MWWLFVDMYERGVIDQPDVRLFKVRVRVCVCACVLCTCWAQPGCKR
jgi:hypothetical protein